MDRLLSQEEREEIKNRQLIKDVQDAIRLSSAIKNILTGEDGQIVIDFLRKQKAGFDKDPYQHAFNAGKCWIVKRFEEAFDDKQHQKHMGYLQEAQNATTEEGGKKE